RKAVDPASANRNFYALQGFEQQNTELAVENIARQHVFEFRARDKLMRALGSTGRRLLEWKPVGAQAVIANMSQVVGGALAIRDRHAASFQQLDLLTQAGGGLVVDHSGRPGKSNPPV